VVSPHKTCFLSRHVLSLVFPWHAPRGINKALAATSDTLGDSERLRPRKKFISEEYKEFFCAPLLYTPFWDQNLDICPQFRTFETSKSRADSGDLLLTIPSRYLSPLTQPATMGQTTTEPVADPTLLHHPLPVRNLIPQIPQTLLATLLTHHVAAYTPKNIKITAITPEAISLSYLQPVEDIGFAPVPRSTKIKFIPPLPAIPSQKKCNEDENAAYEWESGCAARLKEMEAEATKVLDGRSDIVVQRYIPPNNIASFITIFQFLFLTLLIYTWLRFGKDTPYIGEFFATKVFNKEWKFNMAVFFHAAVLVKRWGDVLNMAKKLRKHGVDLHKRGRVMGPWVWWLISSFLEGWRCEKRFDQEVARLGRSKAEAKDGEGETKKKK